MDPLSLFHPLIAAWFREKVGTPTEIQAAAWPAIARGEHVLVTAPTGTGKTLTAFLWAIDRLVTGALEPGRVRVLYLSPLKALNTDVRRNLLAPLAGLEEVFRANGAPFPAIRVETRSGDTPQEARRQMLRRPPEILITTPESLNILLSSLSGRSILGSIATVILDEIHTVVDSKRGVHLITAVDRLVLLSGEFQRIAASATVKPVETVAAFVGGLRLEGVPDSPRYVPRAVSVVKSESSKRYDLRVRVPEDREGATYDDAFWPPLVREFKETIGRNRSTLFFARSRRLAESLAFRINAGADHPIAYAHHGSLAKELRLEVETKLKSGDLKAIVATSSLELGIDIGALDEVVCVQSPPSIASAVQRVGRAGHQVGAVSRGAFYPTHDLDTIASAVIARAVLERDIEAIRPVENALDVLSQVILSMAGTETWDIDALYARLRTSWPYRALPRAQFDLVINMMAGRYARTRVRELRATLAVDRQENTIAARRGALLNVLISGGTIPDRGYYHLRHEETGALIGELDEEYVWEASPGQTMTFGTQHWTIRRITHNEVFVLPARTKETEAPFWKAEVFNRNAYLSEKIGAFLEEAEERRKDPSWIGELERDYRLEAGAAAKLVDFLNAQAEETGRPLPHRGHVLVERVSSGPGGAPGSQIVIHTFWGGRVNRPFALALDAAWEERFGYRLEIFPSDDAIALQVPDGVPAEELMTLVRPGEIERLLRKRLESSGYFGARFRENAGRALLITRRKLSERMPLWMSRLRSQKLLQAVMRFADFPILLETWRTCLRDEFDLGALEGRLAGIANGSIRVSECATSRPSPMAANLTWGQINRYMYAGDELAAGKESRLRGDLLREVVFSPGLRPAVSPETVRAFEEKRQRLSPGYAPTPDRELVEWVKERVVLTWPEWQALAEAVRRDHPAEMEERGEAESAGQGPDAAGEHPREAAAKRGPRGAVAGKIVRIDVAGARAPIVCASERLDEIRDVFYRGKDIAVSALDLAGDSSPLGPETCGPLESENEELSTELFLEWLSFHGPLSLDDAAARLGLDLERLEVIVEDLEDADSIVTGTLVKGAEGEQFADAENFETLLRMERSALAPRVEPRPVASLPLFLARIQGLVLEQDSHDRAEGEALFRAIEKLVGYELPAPLWESEILPARVPDYKVAMLDSVLRSADLRWQGNEDREIRFLFESDFDLLTPEERTAPPGASREQPPAPPDFFADPAARYEFATLLRKAGGNITELEDAIWKEIWAGRLTNDSWSALRRGLQTKFHVGEVIERQKRSLEYVPRRGSLRLSHWLETQAYPGTWFVLPVPASDPEAADLIEAEERRKDRVRILLDRYGILFRELLLRERAPLRWPDLFRTLRLMELSGEVLAGYFFKGVPGPQFMSPAGLRAFQKEWPEDAVYWMSAVDPTSPSGIPIEAFRGAFPKRIEGSHLVFRGERLVLVSERTGRGIRVLVPPDDPMIDDYFDVFRHFLERDFDPMKRVVVETINDEPALQSPYLAALRKAFDVVAGVKQISLYKPRAR